MAAIVEFIEGARGLPVAVLNSYTYHKSKALTNGIKFTYSKRKSVKCKAFMVVSDDGTVVKAEDSHNHQPNPGDIQAQQLRGHMRKRTRDETTSMQTIYDQEKVKLLQQSSTAMASSGETASALAQYQHVKSSLYRERRKRFPLMPSTRGDIDLDGQLTTTVQGDRFLLGEDGDGANKIIAFASNSALHALTNADTYHMDGTFATAPRLFYQIVTLHAFILGVMLPLVFGLLPNKDWNTYIRFLSLVKEKSESIGFTISPQRNMQDFEKGLMNACLHVFPGVIVKGCYFHYAQCLWQRIQGIGLSVSYRENADHRNWFRMLLAMPLFTPKVKMGQNTEWNSQGALAK